MRAHRLGRAALRDLATVVTPDTLLRWHRQLVARKWPYTRKGTGRRGVLAAIRQLAVRMAEDNPTWGYTRIQGALKNVGHQVGRSTIARILKAQGLLPTPQRPTAWQTFLRAHWGAIAGADFFTTEVWTWRGLMTFYTVFVIDLATRRVEVLGTTPNPDDAFMRQVVRTLTMADAGTCRVLICDSGCKVERGGVRTARGGRDLCRADSVSGPECECVRGMIRAIDEGGMSRANYSARRRPFPTSGIRVCRALPSREESPGLG